MQNVKKIIKKIEIYGDSILKGVMLDKDTNKYYIGNKENIKKITNEYPLNITNNTKFGCTITKGYKQLQKDLKKDFDCDYIVLEYGGNDCDFNWKEISLNPNTNHDPNTTLEEFKKIYKQMIITLKEQQIHPILMSLPPISADKYFNWISKDLNKENILKWLKDVGKLYRYQELYSRTVESIAKEMGCLFIDVRTKFLEKSNIDDYCCKDGIHPNEQGHKLILEAFIEFLNTNEIKMKLEC